MKIKGGFVIREICGEKVISGEGSNYANFSKLVVLNETAAYLLESVGSGEFTEESLVALLQQRYDVAAENALADVKVLCLKLKDNGIIE